MKRKPYAIVSRPRVCYKCPDRYVGCHGECQDYLDEQLADQEKKHPVHDEFSKYLYDKSERKRIR